MYQSMRWAFMDISVYDILKIIHMAVVYFVHFNDDRNVLLNHCQQDKNCIYFQCPMYITTIISDYLFIDLI